MSISNTTPNLQFRCSTLWRRTDSKTDTASWLALISNSPQEWVTAGSELQSSATGHGGIAKKIFCGVSTNQSPHSPWPPLLPGLLAFSSWQTLNAWCPGSGLWMVPAFALARRALASMRAATYCGINNNSYDVQIRSEFSDYFTKVRKTSFLQPVYLSLEFFAMASSESPLFGRSPWASAGQNHTGAPPASQKHIKNQDVTC